MALFNVYNIKKMMKDRQKKGQGEFFDAYTITGNQKHRFILRGVADDLNLIPKHLKYAKSDKIRLEFFNDKEQELCLFPLEFDVPTEQLEQQIIPQASQQFQGLGEAEINSIVEQRLKEQKHKEEFIQLQESVQQLTEELEEVYDLNEQLENENEQLKVELESKKQIRYYASMLGDILEGIGISKDKIRNPIASLMGIDETEEKPIVQQNAAKDNSGIIEDDAPKSNDEEKRMEIINLITEFLKARDNQTLSDVFTIFSEIESNPNLAQKLIQFINLK